MISAFRINILSNNKISFFSLHLHPIRHLKTLIVQSLIKILLISVILLALALSGMAFNIIFRKNGKFPKYQVGHNKEMRKLGITCVKHDELKCFKKLKGQSVEDCGSCSG